MMMNSMRKIKSPRRVIVRIIKMMENHLILPNSTPQRVKPKLQSKLKQKLRKLLPLKQKAKG